MSKFKVIDGANITSIANHDREIKMLELEISRKKEFIDKDFVVYGYHFSRLGHPLLAQKYLNKVAADYFWHGIYKDLYQAMLAFSVLHATEFKNPKFDRAYEYFIVVKQSVDMFAELNFEAKSAFMDFRREFREYNTFLNMP